MKKVITLLVLLVVISAMAFAGGSTEKAAEKKTYNVGICQFVQHVALDAATQGFKDAIVAELGAENVKFNEGNASADMATVTTIINGLVS